MKKFLALGMAAMLLLVFAACGGNKAEDPTDPISEEITTVTEPSTLEVAATSDIAETTTAAPDTSATEEATTAGKPSTKAEIVEYYNASANKVKTDKPGFSYRERTHIDKEKIWISSRLLNSMAPTIISWAEGSFTKWTETKTTAKGADHKDFPAPGQSWSSKLKPSMVKSATLTESGANYKIKIVLNDEKMDSLPADPSSTNHGKAMKIMNLKDLETGTENIPVIKIKKFAPAYSGSTIECTIDKATGNMKTLANIPSFDAHLSVNIGNTDATVPIKQEVEYTIKY